MHKDLETMLRGIETKGMETGGNGLVLENYTWDRIKAEGISAEQVAKVKAFDCIDESEHMLPDEIVELGNWLKGMKLQDRKEVAEVAMSGNSHAALVIAAEGREELDYFIDKWFSALRGTRCVYGLLAVLENIDEDYRNMIAREIVSFAKKNRGSGRVKLAAHYVIYRYNIDATTYIERVKETDKIEAEDSIINKANEVIDEMLDIYNYALEINKEAAKYDIYDCFHRLAVYNVDGRIYFRAREASPLYAAQYAKLNRGFNRVKRLDGSEIKISDCIDIDKICVDGIDYKQFLLDVLPYIEDATHVNDISTLARIARTVQLNEEEAEYVVNRTGSGEYRSSVGLAMLLNSDISAERLYECYINNINNTDIAVLGLTGFECIDKATELLDLIIEAGDSHRAPAMIARLFADYESADYTAKELRKMFRELMVDRFFCCRIVDIGYNDTVYDNERNNIWVSIIENVMSSIEATVGLDTCYKFVDIALTQLENVERPLRKFIINMTTDTAPYVETNEMLKKFIGTYDVKVAPEWWEEFAVDVLADTKEEYKDEVLDILNHMKDNPELIAAGRTRENGPRLMRALRKKVKDGIDINKTEWAKTFNKKRSKSDNNRTCVITDSPMTKLGMSSFCKWTSCMDVLRGMMRHTVAGMLTNGDAIIVYITEPGKKVRICDVTHDNMMARAILRTVYNEKGEPIGVMLDRIYGDRESAKDQLKSFIPKKCEELGIDLYSTYGGMTPIDGYVRNCFSAPIDETITTDLLPYMDSVEADDIRYVPEDRYGLRYYEIFYKK